MTDDYTPTTEDVEAIARVLAAIESRKPGWNFSLDQAIEYQTEKWRRHSYEAERLLDEMQPWLTGVVAEKRAEWEGETDWKTNSVEQARIHYRYGVNSGTLTTINTPEMIHLAIRDEERRTMGPIGAGLIETRTKVTRTSPWLPVPDTTNTEGEETK